MQTIVGRLFMVVLILILAQMFFAMNARIDSATPCEVKGRWMLVSYIGDGICEQVAGRWELVTYLMEIIGNNKVFIDGVEAESTFIKNDDIGFTFDGVFYQGTLEKYKVSGEIILLLSGIWSDGAGIGEWTARQTE